MIKAIRDSNLSNSNEDNHSEKSKSCVERAKRVPAKMRLKNQLDPGEESSLAPLTQMAVELKKTPAEALSGLMAKEFLRQKGREEFFCEGDR